MSMQNLGNEEFQRGNYQEAIAHYTRAIELNDQNAIYFSNRANVYYTTQEYERAIADCESALQIDPNFTKVGQ